MKEEAAYKRVWYFDETAIANQKVHDADEAKGLGLTKQQVETFRMAFQLFDADNNNTIDVNEISQVME